MRERLPIIIGAVIAVLLQAIVAPNIHIGYGAPNFILCYVVAIAIANARSCGYITPFVLGLIYDFMGSGPVGAMALLCLIATFFASMAYMALDNETIFIPILVIVVTCFCTEFLYGLLMIACGLDVSLLEALVYRALPCGLYDTVLTLITYPVSLALLFKDRNRPELQFIN